MSSSISILSFLGISFLLKQNVFTLSYIIDNTSRIYVYIYKIEQDNIRITWDFVSTIIEIDLVVTFLFTFRIGNISIFSPRGTPKLWTFLEDLMVMCCGLGSSQWVLSAFSNQSESLFIFEKTAFSLVKVIKAIEKDQTRLD